MSAADLHVGQWVVYRAYPSAPAEDGEVTELRGDLVMVRYWGDRTAKATRPQDLSVGASEPTVDAGPSRPERTRTR